MLLGVDASRHQGHLDVDAIAREGMHFCILKATEGADYEDPVFRANWDALVDYGDATMVRGVYHFARQDNRAGMGRVAGEIEARNLCSVLQRVGHYWDGCLPPALDWEKWAGDAETNLEWIRGFIEVVRSELGRYPMIYTGPNVWAGTTGDSDEFIHLPLWLVKYSRVGGQEKAVPPRLPKSTKRKQWRHTFWQWSGGGEFQHHPKVAGRVMDVNRFDGELGQLRELASMKCVEIRREYTGPTAVQDRE